MEPENKKLFIKGDKYSGPLDEKEEKELIKQFENIKFFDPKIDSLFKIIFGNSDNKDVAKSLIKAVLPEEEEIIDLTFHSLEIRSNSNFNPEQRRITVDINAEDKEKNKLYIIEMQIHEVPDLLGRAELSTSRIFDSLYVQGDSVISLKKKIYSINFLYYDMFPNDKDYYHHIFPHEFNKKNVSIPFKDTIVIELKKFNKKFNESQINELLLNDEKQKRLVERQLWFAFLSKINTLYHQPSSDDHNKYFIIKRKIKIKEKNDCQNQENVDKKKEDKMKEVVVYIKSEISEKLFSYLIKVGPIRKALNLCVNLSESDIDKYLSEVEDHTGLLSIVNYKDQQLKKKDEELEENKKELEENKKKIEENEKKMEEDEKIIEEKNKRIKELENMLNEFNKRNNYNESNNNENNKKTRF